MSSTDPCPHCGTLPCLCGLTAAAEISKPYISDSDTFHTDAVFLGGVNSLPPPMLCLIPENEYQELKRNNTGGMTITEAAKELKVSRPTIHYWLKHGKLDSISLMGIQYIPKTQVERLKK